MTTRQETANQAGAIAPQTLIGLIDSVEARLAVVAARFPLMATKTDRRAPAIVDGWLPPKSASDPQEEQFPFLIVRPDRGVDTIEGADQNATASLKIIIGTFSDTDDGWRDVGLLIDGIRADFGAAPRIEGTAFEHLGPLTWEFADPARPQWFGIVTSIWQLPRPRRVEVATDPNRFLED